MEQDVTFRSPDKPEDETTPAQHLSSASQPPSHGNLPQTTLFHGLSTYPFDTDHEYQAGLASILGHPNTPATAAELGAKQDLVLQAQCFYFSRKFNTPTINPSAYKAWLVTNGPTPPSTAPAVAVVSATASTTADPPASSTVPQQPLSEPPQSVPAQSAPVQQEQPPYPTSFADIVELITNNKPIPGIQEIPDTVLDLGSSKQDKTARRRKPWEKESDTTTTDSDLNVNMSTDKDLDSKLEDLQGHSHDGTATQVAKARNTGEGVVHILKPNAIPDSGLIARD